MMYVCEFSHSLYTLFHYLYYSFTFFKWIFTYLYCCLLVVIILFLFCITFCRRQFFPCFCSTVIHFTPIFSVSVDYYVYVMCSTHTNIKQDKMNQQTTSDSHVHRFYFCISINFSFIFYTSSDQIPNQLLIYGYCWYIFFLRLYYFSNTDVYIFSDVMPLDSFIIFILAERKSYIYFFISI